jgi:hypothetical protein
MARIDDLRPDQRAALQLLLQQGKSYEDIAGLLRIESDAVRERAHAALDALGPEDVPGLSLELQDEVADYLLGQQTASQRAGTRDFLQTSAAGRAWARAVSSELRPLAGDSLPEIPAEAAEVDEAFEALDARSAHRERVERSSRVGGVILIAAGVIALVLIVVLAASVLGGDDDEDEPRAGTTTTASTTQTGAQEPPPITAQINLTKPEGSGGGDRAGVAQIAEQDGKRVVVLVAEGFRPARENPPRFYAIWVRSAEGESRRLGFPPPPDKQGRIATSFPYPDDAERFRDLIITQETQNDPKQPGTVLLSGPIEGTPVNQQATTAPQGAAEPEGEAQNP